MDSDHVESPDQPDDLESTEEMDVIDVVEGSIPYIGNAATVADSAPTPARETVRFDNLRDLVSAFPDDESWNQMGVKLFKARHHASAGMDTQAQMYRHLLLVARALRSELNLRRLPSCLDATIQYAPANMGATDIDTIEVGNVRVTILHEPPTTKIRMDPGPLVGEYMLRAHYGDRGYNCLTVTHGKWEIIEVSHPLREPIEKFPFAVCDPRTVNFAQDHVLDRESSVWPPSEARYLRYGDQHRWFAVSRQYPFELLVRKITSSQQGIDGDLSATVPMAVVNLTGDDQATAEAHIMMRFAVWT